MFWGLTIEPGKRYMQTVSKTFHLSMACLELNNNDNDNVALMLEYEGQEYILCNLQRHRAMQSTLDLNFQTGEKIALYSAGKSRIHLTGYLVDEDLELSEEEGEEEEEEEEEMSPAKNSPGKKRKDNTPNVLDSKKQKLEEADSDDDDDDDIDDTFQELKEDDDDDEDDDEEEEEDDDEEEEDEEEESDEETTVVNKSNKSLQNQTQSSQQNKNQNKVQTPKSLIQTPKNSTQTPKTPTQNGQTPQTGKKNKKKQGGETPKSDGEGGTKKRVLAGGVQVNDVKQGSGPAVKAGQQVTVYYVGRLKQNNKQFDATTSGPGFKFTLGRSEVIKGWDVGVAGMRVGGKRIITIPPPMAYGKKGQPPVIPPNSELEFEVELRRVI